MDTAAKGRRFEYKIRNIFLDQGYVVGRCAASKPWDLTVATRRACYAIECKTSKPNLRREYKELLNKLKVTMSTENKKVTIPCKLVPLLFYANATGGIEMYTEAHFKDESGKIRRPFFDGEVFSEIYALGKNKNKTKGENHNE